MASAFNNAAPTPMYNYQHVIPKPKINPGFNPEVQQDLLTMVFISHIPTVLDDEDMLELLLSCDRIKFWRRVQNADGSLTHFGFCVFETPLGVIRALRSLPWKEDEQFKHELSVFIDIATKNHIRNHQEFGKPKRDKAVLEKKRYLFEPYVGLDPKDFLPPKKEEPKPDQQLVTMFENDESEEQIKARKEKREKEMEFAFQERLRRFEQHEAIRIKRYKDDIEQDRIEREEYIKQKEFLSKRLAEYDDDIEKDREEFYRDPDRWWQRRKREREREYDWDHRDRLAEQEEYEFAREKDADNQRIKEKEPEDVEMAPVEEPENTVPEGFTVTRIMTKDERIQAIQELVSRIPVDKEELWEYQVAWDYLDRVLKVN